MSHGKHPHTPEIVEPPDQWHAHTADEKPQEAHGENVNAPIVLIYGTVAFVFIAVCVVATAIYFNWYATRLKIDREERPDLVESGVPSVRDQYNALRADVAKQMTEYGWADSTTNTYRIPLAKARERVLAQYQSAGK